MFVDGVEQEHVCEVERIRSAVVKVTRIHPWPPEVHAEAYYLGKVGMVKRVVETYADSRDGHPRVQIEECPTSQQNAPVS